MPFKTCLVPGFLLSKLIPKKSILFFCGVLQTRFILGVGSGIGFPTMEFNMLKAQKGYLILNHRGVVACMVYYNQISFNVMFRPRHYIMACLQEAVAMLTTALNESKNRRLFSPMGFVGWGFRVKREGGLGFFRGGWSIGIVKGSAIWGSALKFRVSEVYESLCESPFYACLGVQRRSFEDPI